MLVALLLTCEMLRICRSLASQMSIGNAKKYEVKIGTSRRSLHRLIIDRTPSIFLTAGAVMYDLQ